MVGSCDHNSDPSSYIKDGQFFDYKLLKNVFAPWNDLTSKTGRYYVQKLSSLNLTFQ